jgi:hypothetical protein
MADEQFEKNVRKMSKHDKAILADAARGDTTFHGKDTMDQYGSAQHRTSFEAYKPASTQDKSRKSHTSKNASVHTSKKASAHHDSAPVTNHTQIAPAPDDAMQLFDAEDIESQAQEQDRQERLQRQQRKNSAEPQHREHAPAAHSDTLDTTQAQLAHNRVLQPVDMHAPTALHAGYGNWCTSRCLVFSVFLIVAVAIIVV